MNTRVLCSRPRCKGRAEVEGLCKTDALRKADSLFSAAIRDLGRCEATEPGWIGPVMACGGALQCAHLVPRRYKAIRWRWDNAVPLCAEHHQWGTEHSLDWSLQCKAWLGKDGWAQLRSDAHTLPVLPLAEVIALLEAA